MGRDLDPDLFTGPYPSAGEVVVALHRTGVGQADGHALLSGVLYAWTQFVRTQSATQVARQRFARWLFRTSAKALGWVDSVEAVMALSRAARARHGAMVSARMLFAGRLMLNSPRVPRNAGPVPIPTPSASPSATPTQPSLPTGSAQRMAGLDVALIYDVWRILEGDVHVDEDSACQTIVDTYHGIAGATLGGAVAEGIDYAYGLALHRLGRDEELAHFIWQRAVTRVRTPDLRARLIRLLRAEDGTRCSEM